LVAGTKQDIVRIADGQCRRCRGGLNTVADGQGDGIFLGSH